MFGQKKSKDQGRKRRKHYFAEAFYAVIENVFKKLDWKNKGIRINGYYLIHLWLPDNVLFSLAALNKGKVS